MGSQGLPKEVCTVRLQSIFGLGKQLDLTLWLRLLSSTVRQRYQVPFALLPPRLPGLDQEHGLERDQQ